MTFAYRHRTPANAVQTTEQGKSFDTPSVNATHAVGGLDHFEASRPSTSKAFSARRIGSRLR
jgi:hypothetical protein